MFAFLISVFNDKLEHRPTSIRIAVATKVNAMVVTKIVL